LSAQKATTISPTTLELGEYPPGQDPFPSWKEGSAKQSIINFVRAVTTTGDVRFVKPEARIAVFDNDGTLWSEMPSYFQLAFVFDRLKALAPQHPEWRDQPRYAAVLQGDMKTVAAGGLRDLAPQEPEINQPTIDAVATYLSGHTGEHYSPHVTIGVGTVDYLNALLAAPFPKVPVSINKRRDYEFALQELLSIGRGNDDPAILHVCPRAGSGGINGRGLRCGRTRDSGCARGSGRARANATSCA
jgi:hypothetical protein